MRNWNYQEKGPLLNSLIFAYIYPILGFSEKHFPPPLEISPRLLKFENLATKSKDFSHEALRYSRNKSLTMPLLELTFFQ